MAPRKTSLSPRKTHAHSQLAHADLESSTNKIGDAEKSVGGSWDDGDVGEDVVEVDVVGAFYHVAVSKRNPLGLVPRSPHEVEVGSCFFTRDRDACPRVHDSVRLHYWLFVLLILFEFPLFI
jgi:hypothetical protein